jgi:hypothetical protein
MMLHEALREHTHKRQVGLKAECLHNLVLSSVFFLSLEQVAVAAYISVMESTLLSKHQASTGFSEIALNTAKEIAEHVARSPWLTWLKLVRCIG